MMKTTILVALGLGLTACAGDGGSQSGVRVSAIDGAPYVRLRWAQAQTALVPPFGGYDHVALSATGVIELQNAAYDKQVIVRYQGDQGWADAAASYAGPAAGDHELWRFTTGAVTYLPYFGSGELPFAISYTVHGVTVWDNDAGRNYAVWGQGGDGEVVSSVALGQDALKLADASLTAASDGSIAFAGHVILKNLAYAKDVSIVYTTDGWKTVLTVPAGYDASLVGSDALERWSFSQTLPAGVSEAQLAVSYAVNGTTYWDSDLGANYVVRR